MRKQPGWLERSIDVQHFSMEVIGSYYGHPLGHPSVFVLPVVDLLDVADLWEGSLERVTDAVRVTSFCCSQETRADHRLRDPKMVILAGTQAGLGLQSPSTFANLH